MLRTFLKFDTKTHQQKQHIDLNFFAYVKIITASKVTLSLIIYV